MSQNRINWIDTLKGLGIIVVLLGHAPVSDSLRGYIFSFHMPLFFFISGFLFSIGSFPTFFSFVRKKAKTLLLPYAAFCLISMMLFALIPEGPIELKHALLSFVLSIRNKIDYNVPLWFLTALFVVEMMFYWLIRLLKQEGLILIAAFLLSAVGFLFFNTNDPKLPWTFDSDLYYSFFFGFGYFVRKLKLVEAGKRGVSILLIACSALNLLLLLKPQLFHAIFNVMPGSKVFAFIYSIFLAVIGIFTFCALSRQLQNSSTLHVLGVNTLPLFALHIPFAFYALNKFVEVVNLKVAAPNNMYGMIYTLLAFLLLMPFVRLLNKHFPLLIGKKP